MKKFFDVLFTVCLFGLLIFCFTYREDIAKKIMGTVSKYQSVTLPNDVSYHNDFNFKFVQETNDFHAKNYQGLLNIIYTVLNNGLSEFTFYCDMSYENCLNDFNNISKDQVLLSTINNMVSPYNSYEKIYFTIANYGKIDMKIDKLYSLEDISLTKNKINEIITNSINENMSVRDKIKAFHDYLINNTVYDKDRANNIENGKDDNYVYNSHKASGPLLEGYSLCSGYSDAMKIYLDMLNVPNYKISNTTHIWNLVYLDGQWLHLDLTWDDPITNDGSNLLLHKFFLITTDELKSLDSTSHSYNENYYLEI